MPNALRLFCLLPTALRPNADRSCGRCQVSLWVSNCQLPTSSSRLMPHAFSAYWRLPTAHFFLTPHASRLFCPLPTGDCPLPTSKILFYLHNQIRQHAQSGHFTPFFSGFHHRSAKVGFATFDSFINARMCQNNCPFSNHQVFVYRNPSP